MMALLTDKYPPGYKLASLAPIGQVGQKGLK